MKNTLVIGYGNALRRDDGAGIRAAELLGSRYPEVDVITVHELTPDLTETLSHYETVAFVDATTESSALSCRSIHATADMPVQGSHSYSPESLLFLSRQLLGDAPARSLIVGIPAFSFDFGEELSPRTELAIAELVDRFREILGVET